MNHRHHAAIAIGGLVLFVAGVLLGRVSSPSRPAVAMTEPAAKATPFSVAPSIAEAPRDAFNANPRAKDLIEAMASGDEISLFVSRGLVVVRCGKKRIASNESQEHLAEVRDALDALKRDGLLRISRTVNDSFSGAPTQTTIYALTTKGYEAAKVIKAKE